MSIADLFSQASGGVTGVLGDTYTAAMAMIICLVIIFGVGVLAAFLKGNHVSSGDESFSEAEFNDYAVKKYKRDLYEKTYKTRGIGHVDDMGGDL
jgi:hypothetical protein